MIDDRPGDEISHLDDADEAPRRNRGFWVVAGAMATASIVVIVAIFANIGTKDTIAHAQHSLRSVRAAAEAVRVETGSYGAADAAGLTGAVPDLTLVGAETPSGGLDEVSISANALTWAAAVQARPGACFFLRLDASGEATYGSGTECTGREAELSAVDSDW